MLRHAMARALLQARRAALADEVPVGALLIDAEGQVLAEAGNRVERDRDPTAHAEMLVLRQAAALRGEPRLPDLTLVVTLEPCAMCAAAIAQARLARVVFGAYDPKGGGIDHGPRLFTQPTIHHRPEVIGGFAERACSRLLRRFFSDLRTRR